MRQPPNQQTLDELQELRHALQSELHRLHEEETRAVANHHHERAHSLLGQTVGLKKALHILESQIDERSQKEISLLPQETEGAGV